MTTPPKKLSFAEEMELLKKQKAEQALQTKAEAAQRRMALAASQQHATATLVPSSTANDVDKANASEIELRLNQALAAVLPSDAMARLNKSGMAVSPSVTTPPMVSMRTTPILQEDEHQMKVKAMEAAFSKHVGEHHAKTAKKGKTKGAMLFCTSCRSTTPGEYVKPGNAGIGMALGLVGMIPGIAYFLYRQMASEQQCTHCQATTLVGMNSVQARTLCGDQHAALMEAGWAEMRRAERDHIRDRRMAMAKILVVAVVILGASLYALRSPSSPLKGVISNELNVLKQRQQLEQLDRQQSQGVE